MGCGLLNLATGHLRYASAGHDPPLLRDVDGTVRELAIDNGAALGIERETKYGFIDAFVAPGDALLLFTDGVTEARADDGSTLGLEGLAALLREGAETEPDTLVRRIVDTINGSGLRVEDDLTVLAVSLKPMDVSIRRGESTPHWLLEPEPSPAGVRRAQQWLRSILTARGIAAHKIEDAELIAEELLTNVVRSLGSRGGQGHLSVDCVLRDGEVVLTFSDDAAPFDPLAASASDLDAPIEQRPIGGLGIALVRRLADSCRYDYVDGRNVLEVRLRSNPT
jgi:sigma-B regulation protein RsbU (phosphoserine phosphatase)